MQNGWFSSEKTPQSFYFLEDHAAMPGWFKGMELIINEWGLYPDRGLCQVWENNGGNSRNSGHQVWT